MRTAKRQLFHEITDPDPDPAAAPAIALPRTENVKRSVVQSVPIPTISQGQMAQWMNRWKEKSSSYLLGGIALACIVLFWHFVTTYKMDFYIRFSNIPTPLEVYSKVFEVNSTPKFAINLGISLRRIFIGFAIATVLGITLGLLIGRYKLTRSLLLPAMEVFRPIPAIAWVPISIMLWPDNEVSIVFITFLGAFFPILLNTISGVQAVDGVLLRASQCLGAREPQIMWYVVLPGAAPQIFTGLAVGMGVAWVSLIAAEMISGQFGIGYFTWEAYSLIAYPEIVLGMITIGILGLLCSGLIRVVGQSIMPWNNLSGRTGGAA